MRNRQHRLTPPVDLSPLSGWTAGRMPLLASESIGTVRSNDAEQILGDLITAHHLSTTSTTDFSAAFRSAPVGPIQVIFQQYESFAGIEITEPLPVIAMTIPLAGDLLVKIDGREIMVPHGSPLVFNPGDRPRMMGPATADFLTLTMPRELVAEALAARFPSLGDGSQIAFGTVASRSSAGALAQAMWAVQEALDAGQAQTADERARLSQMLVSSLLLSHPHSHTREIFLAGPAASDAAVWDTVAVLRENPEARTSIAELAKDSGVSTRSLQSGFARLLGVTPSAFQRDLRLELARRRIVTRRPGLTVSQLVTEIGYVNQGRFAADYRRRFGVSPSQDLRATSS